MSVSPKPWHDFYNNGDWELRDANGEFLAFMDSGNSDAMVEAMEAVNALHGAGITRPEGLPALVSIVENVIENIKSLPGFQYEVANKRLRSALAACRTPDA